MAGLEVPIFSYLSEYSLYGNGLSRDRRDMELCCIVFQTTLLAARSVTLFSSRSYLNHIYNIMNVIYVSVFVLNNSRFSIEFLWVFLSPLSGFF